MIKNEKSELEEWLDGCVASNADHCNNEDISEKEFQNKIQTIKGASPFTKNYINIEQTILTKLNEESFQDLESNDLYNQDFIDFLQKNFMPYHFLWGGFVYRGLPFSEITTHLTDGPVENLFYFRKQLISESVTPSVYINSTVFNILGQCKRKRSNDQSEDEQSDESENEEEEKDLEIIEEEGGEIEDSDEEDESEPNEETEEELHDEE